MTHVFETPCIKPIKMKIDYNCTVKASLSHLNYLKIPFITQTYINENSMCSGALKQFVLDLFPYKVSSTGGSTYFPSSVISRIQKNIF